MRVLGVIPARWDSSRLPGKSLVELCGKPLIAWVAEAVARANCVDEVLVATDDERIAAAARACGVRPVMTAAEHPSGTDRVAEAVRTEPCDLVINIQGDEPLIEPVLIDRLAEVMAQKPGWDMITAASPITSVDEAGARSVVKVVCDRDDRALYFSRLPIPFVRDESDEPDGLPWRRHLGIYGYRRPFLERLVATPPCVIERCEKLEQLRALYIGGRIGVVETREPGIGVDTPADVPVAERLLRERAHRGGIPLPSQWGDAGP